MSQRPNLTNAKNRQSYRARPVTTLKARRIHLVMPVKGNRCCEVHRPNSRGLIQDAARFVLKYNIRAGIFFQSKHASRTRRPSLNHWTGNPVTLVRVLPSVNVLNYQWKGEWLCGTLTNAIPHKIKKSTFALRPVEISRARLA